MRVINKTTVVPKFKITLFLLYKISLYLDREHMYSVQRSYFYTRFLCSYLQNICTLCNALAFIQDFFVAREDMYIVQQYDFMSLKIEAGYWLRHLHVLITWPPL